MSSQRRSRSLSPATLAEFNEARRSLAGTVFTDQSGEYVGDSQVVSFPTDRQRASGDLRRRRPTSTSLANAGDATLTPDRLGLPPSLGREPEPQPAPLADDVAPPPSDSPVQTIGEQTFVGRPRAAVAGATTVQTPPGYRRDTSFYDRVYQTGKYAPEPLTPGDTTADGTSAIGANLSPIALQDEVTADDSATALAILDGVDGDLQQRYDEFMTLLDEGPNWSDDDEADDDDAAFVDVRGQEALSADDDAPPVAAPAAAGDDDGSDDEVDAQSAEEEFDADFQDPEEEFDEDFQDPEEEFDEDFQDAIEPPTAIPATRKEWKQASLQQRLALAKEIRSNPAIAKLLQQKVIRYGDLIDSSGAVSFDKLQAVRSSLVDMEQDSKQSYKEAAMARGFDRSGEQAAVIRGLNSTIPGNRRIGNSKYVIWQGATYSNEG